jgi:hypothetical protein
MQHSLSPITADSEPVMGEFSHVRFPTYWSILLTSEKFKQRRMGRRWCVSQHRPYGLSVTNAGAVSYCDAEDDVLQMKEAAN